MPNFGDVKSDQLQEYFYIPPSVIFPYGGTAAPTGFVFCDGSQYGTATYPALFDAIGYTYGGSGTAFRVPDMRGRVPAARDKTNNLGGTAAILNSLTGQGTALNGTGGAQAHTLTTTQIPSHNHGTVSSSGASKDLNHNHGGATNGGNMTLGAAGVQIGGYGPAYLADANGYPAGSIGTYYPGVGAQGINADNLNHTHSNNLSTSAGNGYTGGGGDESHNNLQPTIVVNYIIKT